MKLELRCSWKHIDVCVLCFPLLLPSELRKIQFPCRWVSPTSGRSVLPLCHLDFTTPLCAVSCWCSCPRKPVQFVHTGYWCLWVTLFSCVIPPPHKETPLVLVVSGLPSTLCSSVHPFVCAVGYLRLRVLTLDAFCSDDISADVMSHGARESRIHENPDFVRPEMKTAKKFPDFSVTDNWIQTFETLKMSALVFVSLHETRNRKSAISPHFRMNKQVTGPKWWTVSAMLLFTCRVLLFLRRTIATYGEF